MTRDPLGDLSMKPTRDELAQRQQKSGKAPVRQPSPSAPKPPAAPGGGAIGTLWSIIILMLIVMGGGGWFLWQKIDRLQASLEQSTQALATSEKALTGLQASLENRDKTLNRSGDQMANDIKALESEVRKLWDVANKRTKAALDEQTAAITKLQTDLKTQSGSVDKQVASTVDVVTKVKQEFAALQENDKQMGDALDKLQSDLSKVRAQLAENPSDLEDRVTNIEVSMKSIDAYRKQVNLRLDQMDQQLGQVYRQPTTP